MLVEHINKLVFYTKHQFGHTQENNEVKCVCGKFVQTLGVDYNLSLLAVYIAKYGKVLVPTNCALITVPQVRIYQTCRNLWR